MNRPQPLPAPRDKRRWLAPLALLWPLALAAPAVMAQDTVRVGFGVRNLFNQFYYDQASYGFSTDRGMFLGYPDPGRNVWVNVAWRF